MTCGDLPFNAWGLLASRRLLALFTLGERWRTRYRRHNLPARTRSPATFQQTATAARHPFGPPLGPPSPYAAQYRGLMPPTKRWAGHACPTRLMHVSLTTLTSPPRWAHDGLLRVGANASHAPRLHPSVIRCQSGRCVVPTAATCLQLSAKETNCAGVTPRGNPLLPR